MQLSGPERIQEQVWLGGKDDTLGIMQEIKLWTYRQIVYAHTRICPEKIIHDLEISPGQKTCLIELHWHLKLTRKRNKTKPLTNMLCSG